MKLACLLLSTAALGACVVYDDDDGPRRHRRDDDARAYTPDPAPSSGSDDVPNDTPTPATPNPSPMLVEVEADQTMDAVGGDGVGVFVEYKRGGHWHVWWTCDTTRTKQTCDYAIGVTAMSGTVTNVDGAELEGGYFSSPTISRIEARSTTSTQLHGLRFDTDPGAVIKVDASVGGLKDGAFLFFIQDGKVNGGYTGKLSNPLQFQGSAP